MSSPLRSKESEQRLPRISSCRWMISSRKILPPKNTSKMAAPLSDALKFDGKTYYLTREWNNMCIHYNTKAFEDAGVERPKDDWTWDDFIAVAQKLTKGDAGNKNFGLDSPSSILVCNHGLTPMAPPCSPPIGGNRIWMIRRPWNRSSLFTRWSMSTRSLHRSKEPEATLSSPCLPEVKSP